MRHAAHAAGTEGTQRRTPAPKARGFALVCPPANQGDAARGRKVPPGTGKFQALGMRRGERARGRARRGEVNGMVQATDGVCNRHAEGGREERVV
jgi:hypothetical protein